MKTEQIQVLIDVEKDGEQVAAIKKLYARVLHEAACTALTRVCATSSEVAKTPKGLRLTRLRGVKHDSAPSASDVEYARLWFKGNKAYDADIRAEKLITFKELCYVLDLPHKELKSLILQLIRSINNNIFIYKYINIYINIYNNNIYNNIPCGDK